jgi:predicted permease
VEGRPPLPEGTGGMVAWRLVSPGYFSALRIPIARGRGFLEQDRSAADNFVIISESLARRLFPGEDPIGKRIDVGVWCTVIGVAADVKNGGLAVRPDPEYYLLRKHRPDGVPTGFPDSLRRASVILRTSLAPEAVARWVRSEVAALDPKLPVETQTLEERVVRLAERPRFDATLLGAFALTGLVLAAIGLYGVMAFLVARRTQEIGVRMALGATSGTIARLVLASAGRWATAGIAAGLTGALAVTRYLRALLFHVPEKDPASLAAAAALLLAAALLAAWLPARRAARIDPNSALRIE